MYMYVVVAPHPSWPHKNMSRVSVKCHVNELSVVHCKLTQTKPKLNKTYNVTEFIHVVS